MLAAAQYYETHAPELGVRFLHEVRLATDALSRNPHAAPAIKYGIRRRLIKRFPFGLLHAIEPTIIVILAVMHLRRRPGYWEDRLRNQ
jgi:hypothetical protein